MQLVVPLLVAAAMAAPGKTLATSGDTGASAGASAPTRYLLSGNRSLRPSAISDDGIRTYIEWPEQLPLPAVFAINHLGEEEAVDSHMRAGVLTIDHVYPKLVFRIGKDKAVARRRLK